MNEEVKKAFEQMLGVTEVPKSVEDLYKKVKFAYDRIGGGPLQPQILAVIAALGTSEKTKNSVPPIKGEKNNVPPIPNGDK
jgi:hypothetical protein